MYSTKDLAPLGTFTTPLRDGWGAAADGGLMVLSDGGDELTWVDPGRGFERVRSVKVQDGGRPVKYLNEVRPGGNCFGGGSPARLGAGCKEPGAPAAQ